jgi:hypothetical protein
MKFEDKRQKADLVLMRKELLPQRKEVEVVGTEEYLQSG